MIDMIPIEKVKEKICKDCVCVKVCKKEEYQTPCKKYITAMQMHDWTKQQMVENACEWLTMTIDFFNNGEFNRDRFINDFKKAMEE